jgi:4-alpha-glucanotransferase
MKKDNYAWMSDRIAYNLRIFDALRIDHFRGISGYYCIPFGSPNAVNGTWKKGPGFELFKDKTSLPIVAEDLGFLDDDVKEMLKETTYPGMKILEFAFDGRKENTDKPSNYLSSNSVCYTGTHDNMPMCGYLMSLKDEELKTVEEDVRSECLLDGVAFRDGTYQELTYTIDQLCYASKAFLAVLPLQDLLALDDSARMNKPSTLSNMNWSFRVKKEDFSPELSARLKEYVLKYHR